ncbi:Phosphatidate cytidylyltransferase [Metamycoplasma cloacale]|nr:Phosphatidate cytidylyltransferase [Metamycoplasma cloacale]
MLCMNSTKTRLKSAIILFAIIIPFFFITYFAKTPGKIIGTIFFATFSVWATFEIVKHNKLNIVLNVFISLLTIFVWIFPLNESKETYLTLYSNQTSLVRDDLIQMLKLLIWGYDNLTHMYVVYIAIIFVVITIIFLINIKKYSSVKQFLIHYLITFFVLWYIPLFSKIIFIHNVANPFFILCMFAVPIVVDTSGYFVGKAFGHAVFQKKFAPHISPKKTWEGAIGSYLLGALFVILLFCIPGVVSYNSSIAYYLSTTQIVLATLLLPAISIIGDLLFSLIKRLQQIKDFSNLIPGHGGLMDRFDSVSLVAIVASIIFVI